MRKRLIAAVAVATAAVLGFGTSAEALTKQTSASCTVGTVNKISKTDWYYSGFGVAHPTHTWVYGTSSMLTKIKGTVYFDVFDNTGTKYGSGSLSGMDNPQMDAYFDQAWDAPIANNPYLRIKLPLLISGTIKTCTIRDTFN